VKTKQNSGDSGSAISDWEPAEALTTDAHGWTRISEGYGQAAARIPFSGLPGKGYADRLGDQGENDNRSFAPGGALASM